ncbi:MAG TPA: hypothetical protein DCZ03_15660 [Gammaproteobacteria bacterium]|nr:hypothetical protein [Gammaproteobacteria bacterium]
MSQIQNIIFDLGAVLIEWDPHKFATAAFADPLRQRIALEKILTSPIWSQLDRGALSEELAAQQLANEISLTEQEIHYLFDFVRTSLVLIPETHQLLLQCVGRHYDVFCLSNVSTINFRFLKARYDFFSLFKGIVISGDTNLLKPEIAIYRHLLEKFNLHAESCLFIDDSELNTQAAAELGLHTVTFINVVQCQQELAEKLANWHV